jgi:hypothetical protein
MAIAAPMPLVNRTQPDGPAAGQFKARVSRDEAERLLLQKSPKRRDGGRALDGKVAVEESNRLWCSDGFEVACENVDVVTGVFMKDYCDLDLRLACMDRPWPA